MRLTHVLPAALLLAPLAALHAADAAPANLLQNPSFEKVAGDGVEAWTSRAWAGKEATRWSVETPGRTGDLRQGNRSIPVMDGVATVDETGKQWSVALLNRHPAEPVACTVKMNDRLLDGEYAAFVLDGDSPAAFNDIANPNRVTPQKTTLTFTKGAVNLPPHSLTIVKVPLK